MSGPIDPKNGRVRLLIVLRSFSAGGAERQMIELLRAIDQARFEVCVACFYDGPWRGLAAAIPGIAVHVLEKRGRYDLPGFLRSMLRTARAFKPDLVYGYMFAADLVALLVGRVCGARVVWGLRSSALDFKHYDRFARLMQWASRRSAHRVDLVISNSAAGLRDYRAGRARPRHAVVIPNGIDCERFRPDPAARAALRAQWGVAPGDIAIGLVARIDPMKGQDSFVRAAQEFLAREPRGLFIVAGGATPQNEAFAAGVRNQADALGIAARLRWVGQCDRPEQVFAALDIVTSASRFGEGFSNSIGEAMACGTPCVVTRIGDSADIVGDLGVVVPPEDPGALVEGWRRVCAEPARFAAAAVRARIVTEFSVRRYVQATEQALLGTLDDRAADGRL